MDKNNYYLNENGLYAQAVNEVLHSLVDLKKEEPELFEKNIVKRLITPDRIIQFKVTWLDRNGEFQVNQGFRVQHCNALGPYKGGLRFHPSVTSDTLKFLAFEQTFKNAITGLPLGGAKGGSDFDPKDKTDAEIMNFCQSFMTELYKYIGPNTDIPAGDIGVGAREIGYLYGQYKRLTSINEGVLTGKSPLYGGLKGRKEATGYGLCYFVKNYLDSTNDTFMNKRVVVSGSGNVAIYAAQKATELGATVIGMSDSNGAIYNEKGIDVEFVKRVKEVDRCRIGEYLKYDDSAVYLDSPKELFKLNMDILLPCATQNEVSYDDAKQLIEHGCKLVAEGANMPVSQDAIAYLLSQGCVLMPGKVANSGGVMCSGFEMAQNSQHTYYFFDEVDHRLKSSIQLIYKELMNECDHIGEPYNFIKASNILAFKKLSRSIKEQGL